ncbi:hypothetical protein F2Q70_00041071 [Brassica cretica]|uniref:Uncharacterized protein n=1 Tax=Brassica cretica TaxID=69181 RepID=A0A8S9K504_BRACR|nr:hypothetical protein F2Q70_00041071 [Brassica cretica]
MSPPRRSTEREVPTRATDGHLAAETRATAMDTIRLSYMRGFERERKRERERETKSQL